MSGMATIPCPVVDLSRLRDYNLYFELQCWIRDTFSDSAPLAVEFHLFQETAG
jgi:hypothetical protein